MSISYNKVIVAGNLTRDPETRIIGNDRAVANLGLAVNRKFRDRDGNMQDETTFVDVECWGRTAELAGQYLAKGRACLVEGRLKLDQWEDKDGQKRSKLKVLADAVQFLDSRGNGGQSGSQPERRPAPSNQAPSYDQDPPF